MKEMLSYDDVLILPKYSNIVPKNVNIESCLSEQIKLRVPIITSPMDTITESAMAIEMAQIGGAGFIHKNMDYDRQIEEINKVKSQKPGPNATLGLDGKLFVGISISHSITDENLERLVNSNVDALILDSAHGHSENIIKKAKYIKSKYPNIILVAGNVATKEGARALAKVKCDAIRVGIGPGAICTTRIVAGIGMPQLSAIMECVKGVKGTKTKIIADGGLKSSGDMVKALAAGAHSLIIGSMASGTDETPGEILTFDKIKYKSYRGMGSIGAMKQGSADRYSQESNTKPEKLVPEGVEGFVKYKGSIKDVIFQYIGGIKAGFGYVGAQNIIEFQHNANFVKVTTAGLNESHPHSLDWFKESVNYRGKNG